MKKAYKQQGGISGINPLNIDLNHSILPEPGFRSDIEGMRAIAVTVVVLFHARVPGFSGGFIGVDVFFVLSGYLITWLLVDEMNRSGCVDLPRFYARRFRRLLPAAAFVSLVALVGTAFLYAPFEQIALSKTWLATALYSSNVLFARESLEYHGLGAAQNPLLHTWSLSVEEQFYALWPVVLLLGTGLLVRRRAASRPDLRRLIQWLVVATLASFGCAFLLTQIRGAWAFYLSPTRAWEFGIGALAILVPSGRAEHMRAARAAWMFGGAGLLGLAIATVMFDEHTPYPGGAALLPALATTLVLRGGMGAADHGPYRWLAARPMQALGTVSYGWYLWHWPVLALVGAIAEPVPEFWRGAAVVLSLGLAVATYHGLENPVRRNAWLADHPGRSLKGALSLTLAMVLIVSAWWGAARSWSQSSSQVKFTEATRKPQIYADDCDHFGRAEAVECLYGDSTGTRTVVLVGDSHAGQYFPALDEAARTNGWRLVVITLSSCPFVDLPGDMSEALGQPYPQCVQWRTNAVRSIEHLNPEVTIVASASAYNETAARWQVGTWSSLRALQAYSNRLVLVLDPPVAAIDVPSCLARKEWRWDPLDPDCTPRGLPATRALVAAQQRAADEVSGTELFDIRDEVCVIGVCSAEVNGIPRYRDGDHLSVAFAETFAPAFASLLSGPRISELD